MKFVVGLLAGVALASARAEPQKPPMVDELKMQIEQYVDVFIRAGGRQSDGAWKPIPLDKDGRVICAPQ